MLSFSLVALDGQSREQDVDLANLITTAQSLISPADPKVSKPATPSPAAIAALAVAAIPAEDATVSATKGEKQKRAPRKRNAPKKPFSLPESQVNLEVLEALDDAIPLRNENKKLRREALESQIRAAGFEGEIKAKNEFIKLLLRTMVQHEE